MHLNVKLQPDQPPQRRTERKFYMPVISKFLISHGFAFLWVLFSIILAMPWIKDLGSLVTTPIAVIIITGIAFLPGYINAFLVVSLLLDRQPALKVSDPDEPITILIACRNEEQAIAETLGYIARGDYRGHVKVIVIDNNSSDNTALVAGQAGARLGVDVEVLYEATPGKYNALNAALRFVNTEYVVTLDADTILMRSSLRYLVSRMLSAPADVGAVAGSVLARNSRDNLLTRLQEWDFFLGIASVKRLQGLYQGTLVAQGAFSLYKTDAIRAIGGWPNAIGEDIVLTWRLLEKRWRVYFEPLAVVFTEVPRTLTHFIRQRSRWARGMVEGLRAVRPWQQPLVYTKYLTSLNLLMPYLDLLYTFCWIPGLFLALCGHYWIVGPYTLFVLPLALVQNYILYCYQKQVFQELGLRIRRNRFGFFLYVLCYQMVMSPISVLGYLQELFKWRRVWK
ncbi:MAG: glycosyltransferase family 2 protein [Firmicutes bacterium]|nr:glycosyltransferase family 2 protein [Bacillota bacterium]